MKEADGFLYSKALRKSLPYWGKPSLFRRLAWKALGFRWYTQQEWKIKSKFGWTLEDLHDL